MENGVPIVTARENIDYSLPSEFHGELAKLIKNKQTNSMCSRVRRIIKKNHNLCHVYCFSAIMCCKCRKQDHEL